MNILERVDAGNVENFFRLGSALETSSLIVMQKFDQLTDAKVSSMIIRQKKMMASSIANMKIEGGDIKQDEFMLRKIVNVLAVLGYTELANELGVYTNKIYHSRNVYNAMLNELIDGAIKKSRSDAASGYRHYLSDEVLAIMKATWKKNPALSKKKMINKLLIRYTVNGVTKIDDKTLKDWIKKEKLLPPRPKKYMNSDLVIPPQYA